MLKRGGGDTAGVRITSSGLASGKLGEGDWEKWCLSVVSKSTVDVSSASATTDVVGELQSSYTFRRPPSVMDGNLFIGGPGWKPTSSSLCRLFVAATSGIPEPSITMSGRKGSARGANIGALASSESLLSSGVSGICMLRSYA